MVTSEDVSTFHKLQMERRRNGKAASVEELVDMGFALRDVARMLNTNVFDVQSWRRGDKAWFSDAMKVAHLLAVTDMLSRHGVGNPVAWLETPVLEGFAVRPMDLYPEDTPLLLELASGQASPEKVLDIRDPGWRRRGPSKFEVFEAPDGDLAIRLRDGDAGNVKPVQVLDFD